MRPTSLNPRPDDACVASDAVVNCVAHAGGVPSGSSDDMSDDEARSDKLPQGGTVTDGNAETIANLRAEVAGLRKIESVVNARSDAMLAELEKLRDYLIETKALDGAPKMTVVDRAIRMLKTLGLERQAIVEYMRARGANVILHSSFADLCARIEGGVHHQ